MQGAYVQQHTAHQRGSAKKHQTWAQIYGEPSGEIAVAGGRVDACCCGVEAGAKDPDAQKKNGQHEIDGGRAPRHQFGEAKANKTEKGGHDATCQRPRGPKQRMSSVTTTNTKQQSRKKPLSTKPSKAVLLLAASLEIRASVGRRGELDDRGGQADQQAGGGAACVGHAWWCVVTMAPDAFR
jgi:hypothetical protein